MSEQKRILVIGATGAMGQYLVPELVKRGCLIDAIAAEDKVSDLPGVRYFKINAHDRIAMMQFYADRIYDGIVDFMIYGSGTLPYALPMHLSKTAHYIYLSSYRVYDGLDIPVTENARRLIDNPALPLLTNSDDYSIAKARGENILRGIGQKNWTIIRPAITYSLMRYQLVTLEAPDTVGRAFAGKKVVLPEQARNVQATMTWAGDVAAMIASLVLDDKTLGETYSVCTAEHRTWAEVADYYKDICDLQAVWVDQEDYNRMRAADPWDCGARWQLMYDRLFDRIMDNSKILAVTGMKQSELKSLYDGLKLEIGRCPRDYQWRPNPAMDELLQKRGIL